MFAPFEKTSVQNNFDETQGNALFQNKAHRYSQHADEAICVFVLVFQGMLYPWQQRFSCQTILWKCNCQQEMGAGEMKKVVSTYSIFYYEICYNWTRSP